MTHPFPDLPEGLLETLEAVVPGFTLVGSFARDYWVHTIAGLPRGARKVPTLSSMIGLKTIAWNYRGATTQKDARDLGPLLRATYHGANSEMVWQVNSQNSSARYEPASKGNEGFGR